MAIAINNSCLVQELITGMQKKLDRVTGGGRGFQIHRVCAYATIVSSDPELWLQLPSTFDLKAYCDGCLTKNEALNWQGDPDDDLDELEVLHHLRQQAAAVPILSSVISRRDHSNDATTLSGSALSPFMKAKTQGRLLSSFHRYSYRQSHIYSNTSYQGRKRHEVIKRTHVSALLPLVENDGNNFFWNSNPRTDGSDDPIVWESPPRDDYVVFWQLQWDVVDLFSRRTLPASRPGKRRRTAFNPFLQVSDSPVVEDTSRRSPLPHARRFNGVRYRPDRRTWVAEMKPRKHKTKQDFGNFKSEAEAARAVDAAFHHYGRPDLLNFPDTSLQFLSTRPKAPPGLDEKAKVKFVKEEAKLLLAAIPATSPFHSTPTNSLLNLELSASPSRHPSGYFRSLSEISWPFSCSDPDEVDDAISQPQPWVILDSTCDIFPTGVQTNLETFNSVQNAEQGWDLAEDSSTLAAPPNVVNPNACEIRSQCLDSLIRSPPASMYLRSPSPSRFQDDIAYALLEQQSFST